MLCRIKQKDFSGCIEAVEQILALPNTGTSHRDALVNMAACRRGQGDYSGCIEAAKQSQALPNTGINHWITQINLKFCQDMAGN